MGSGVRGCRACQSVGGSRFAAYGRRTERSGARTCRNRRDAVNFVGKCLPAWWARRVMEPGRWRYGGVRGNRLKFPRMRVRLGKKKVRPISQSELQQALGHFFRHLSVASRLRAHIYIYIVTMAASRSRSRSASASPNKKSPGKSASKSKKETSALSLGGVLTPSVCPIYAKSSSGTSLS